MSPLSRRRWRACRPRRDSLLRAQKLSVKLFHQPVVRTCLCRRGPHIGGFLPLGDLGLRRLVVLTVVLAAIPRRLRERRRSRGELGRRQRRCSYFAGAVEVVTPTSGWLPSMRWPPPLLEVMPLSSFGDTVVSGRSAEQAARMQAVSRMMVVRMVFSLVVFGRSGDSATSRSVVPPATALSVM